MNYAIFPLAAMILFSSFSYASLGYASVIVSFSHGKFDPTVVSAVGGRITEEFKDLGMLKAVVPQTSIDSIRLNPSVDFVERDGKFQVAGAEDAPPTTTSAAGNSSPWPLQSIGAQQAYSLNYTGKGVKIGVLDTGIDYNHPDLAPNYKGGYNFISDNNDPMDDNGHGTHVAGILAAARDAKHGIAGVAPNAELYAVKVSDSKGKGSFSTLVEGIDWAIQNHMDIVTMSITGEEGSQALAKAVYVAYHDYGIILVAAVGNGNANIESTLYPAGYPEVIGVGCVDRNNKLCSFSLIGSDVELVAPGYEIKSTWPGGKYAVLSGTSMATPFVTGAIALLLQSNEKAWNSTIPVKGDGKWTPDDIRQVLRATAKHLDPNGRDDSFGYGLVNLHFPDKIAPPASNTSNETATTIPPIVANKTNDNNSTSVNKEEKQMTNAVLSGTAWLGLKLSFYAVQLKTYNASSLPSSSSFLADSIE